MLSGKFFKAFVLDGLLFGIPLGMLILQFTGFDKEHYHLPSHAMVAAFLFIVGAALSVVLRSFWDVRSTGQLLFGRRNPLAEVKPWFKTFAGWQLLFCFGVLIWQAVEVTNFSFSELGDREGFRGAMRIFGALLNPDWSVLRQGVVEMINTIFIAFLATALAVPFAFVLSFFCARNIMGKNIFGMTLYTILRSIFNISRSVEPIIWAIVFSIWVGIGPFAGMLALFIHSMASLAKLYSEQIECINDGPIEGVQATGAGPLQVIWYAVVPQVVMPHLGYTIYRWDINVRMATIIGFVGGGGIGTLLFQYQGRAEWDRVGTLVVLITLVVWAMDTLSSYIREALK